MIAIAISITILLYDINSIAILSAMRIIVISNNVNIIGIDID